MKLLISTLILLGVSCVPYFETSFENYGVKGKLASRPNKKIAVQIVEIDDEMTYPFCYTKTDSEGNFKVESQTKTYLTHTISGPILRPPSRKVIIKIFVDEDELLSKETEEVDGYFDIGEKK